MRAEGRIVIPSVERGTWVGGVPTTVRWNPARPGPSLDARDDNAALMPRHRTLGPRHSSLGTKTPMRFLPKDRDEGWTPYAWLIYLVLFACWPGMKHGTSALEWVLTAVGLVAFLALYFRGFWVSGNRLLVVIAAITLLGVLYWPRNPGAGSFFIYAAAFAGNLPSTRRAGLGILIISLVVAVQMIVLRLPWCDAFWPLVFGALIGAINIHYSQRHLDNAKL